MVKDKVMKSSKKEKTTAKKDISKKSSEEIKNKQPEINIGMIGHVDHGKTSLTKALTGTWTDTHSEELKRGISIRLGYADATFYKIKNGKNFSYTNKKEEVNGNKESERTVSFVDAPGHETLMTTMLSGAALMNGAVLVIAANEECPQGRTIEHLMALKFAGVKNIVVAQNKIDLIEREEVIKNYEKIKKFLSDYGYNDTLIIPTSANFGANIDLLIEAIEEEIPTPKYDTNKKAKMFVARSFDINKPGTKISDLRGAVLGGSISQGSIKIGDEIELYPGITGSTITKVTSLSCSRGSITQASPGGLIAVGTLLDPSIAQNDQLRGKILAAPNSLPNATNEMKITYEMFNRKTADVASEIKVNEPLVLTIGTNTNIGFVSKVTKSDIEMKLKNPEVFEKGEKVAVSKNINSQWRLVAFGEII